MMSDERPVQVLPKRQTQAVEHLPRAVPGKAIAEPLDLRLESRIKTPPHERIGAICADEQIAVINLVQRLDRAMILDLDAGTCAKLLNELIELQSADRRESIAIDIHPLVAVDDTLHRPRLQAGNELLVEIRHIAFEEGERVQRKDNPEAEGCIRRILLKNSNVRCRKAPLDQQREE